MKQNMLTKKRKLKEGEIIKLKYDEAFKMMYANPEHIEILTALISKILKVKYEDIEGRISLLPLNNPNKTIGEKKLERDIVVSLKTDSKYKIIIELNIRKGFYDTIINRNLLYLNDVARGGVIEGEGYIEIPTTILVNLNDFFINSREKIFDEYLYRNEEGDVLTYKNRILNINIEKCYKVWYNKQYENLKEDDKDLLLFCASLEIDENEDFTNCIEEINVSKRIKEVMKAVILEMCQDEELVGRYYNKEEEEERILSGIIQEEKKKSLAIGIEQGKLEGIEEGKLQGIEEGKLQGIKEGKLEGLKQGKSETLKTVVLNLQKQNLELETISEICNLSKSEVLKILNDNKN